MIASRPTSSAPPLELEQAFAHLAGELRKRAYDDATAEQCAQWLAAAEHLEGAANSMSILNAIEDARLP